APAEAAAPPRAVAPRQLHQRARIANGRRTQDVGIEDRERRGIETKGERDRADDGDGEHGRPKESTACITSILAELLEPLPARRVSRLLPQHGRIPEGAPRG